MLSWAPLAFPWHNAHPFVLCFCNGRTATQEVITGCRKALYHVERTASAGVHSRQKTDVSTNL